MYNFQSTRTNKRGRRTIVKEKLYKVILKNIREMYPNFNIGITTGTRGNIKNRWFDLYWHQLFKTENSILDKVLMKRANKK